MRKLTNMLRNADWKRLLSYAALFFVLFFVFLYLTFPFDTIRDAMVKRIESQGSLNVDIEQISPFRLFGFRIEGFKLANATDPSQVYINLDELRVRLRPSQLLRGRLWFDFDIYAYGGGIAGSYCKRGEVNDLALNFVNLNLNKYGTRDVVRTYGTMDLGGTLSGNLEAHLNKANRRANSGFFNLNLDQLRVANIKILNNELPDLVFEPGRVAFTLNTQSFKVDQFDLKSPHLEVQLSGRITLAEELKRSRLLLTLKYKLSEDIESALGVMALALKEPDSEGFYRLRLTGPLNKLKTRN